MTSARTFNITGADPLTPNREPLNEMCTPPRGAGWDWWRLVARAVCKTKTAISLKPLVTSRHFRRNPSLGPPAKFIA